MPNYKINLIDVKRLDDLSCFQTDLQIIFGMLKYRSSREGLSKYMQSHKEYFGSIDVDSYNAVRVMLGWKKGLEEVKPKQGGGVNLCKALYDLYQDGVKEGIEYKLIEQVKKKLAKGKNPEEIADDLEEPVEAIQGIIASIRDIEAKDAS